MICGFLAVFFLKFLWCIVSELASKPQVFRVPNPRIPVENNQIPGAAMLMFQCFFSLHI